jgi:hypothetical protein
MALTIARRMHPAMSRPYRISIVCTIYIYSDCQSMHACIHACVPRAFMQKPIVLVGVVVVSYNDMACI